jgi:hypothetical protein
MQWEPTTRLPMFFGNLYRFIGNNTQEEAFIARQVGGNPYDGTNLYSIDLLYKEHFGPITAHPKS